MVSEATRASLVTRDLTGDCWPLPLSLPLLLVLDFLVLLLLAPDCVFSPSPSDAELLSLTTVTMVLFSWLRLLLRCFLCLWWWWWWWHLWCLWCPCLWWPWLQDLSRDRLPWLRLCLSSSVSAGDVGCLPSFSCIEDEPDALPDEEDTWNITIRIYLDLTISSWKLLLHAKYSKPLYIILFSGTTLNLNCTDFHWLWQAVSCKPQIYLRCQINQFEIATVTQQRKLNSASNFNQIFHWQVIF